MRALTPAVALLAIPQLVGAQDRPFRVTDTSVVQGRFTAIATSRDTILSTYPRAGREVRMRFSINGLENEFPSGTEHTIYLRPNGGRQRTVLYRFADETEPPPPTPEQSAKSEDGTAQLTVRLDLRDVLRAIRSQGRYAPPHIGAPVTRVEHVYVLGDPGPLTWDYGALTPGGPTELRDADGDGIYEGTLAIETFYTRPRAADGRARWARTVPLDAMPTMESSQRLQDAIHRLSLEELTQLVRDDGALSAGAKWPGVWTRDVSLSTILSLALVLPDAAKRSLLAKVDSSGRIIQDTGTGGSWPVSSDRVVWTLAAWELYAVTGDRDWLRRAYDIAARSAEADLHAVRTRGGLFAGESSFMDWREQSYPRWMQPADIYTSRNLGTNAAHAAAYDALAAMASALGTPDPRWGPIADSTRAAINRELWQPSLGWYAQYQYGRASLARSPRSDALGEALATIYGIGPAERARTVVASAPTTPFGAPSFWPFIPGERLYHNATIWPFVNAYWTWAATVAGNTTAVQRGLDDATRTTALFLTNKENLVAATGHFEGTALNSDRQLWSVAGTLASTYRVLLGMRLMPNALTFRPMVPPSYGGTRTLRNFRYRGATLTVIVRGFGDGVARATLDGAPIAAAEVPATIAGAHTIELSMNGRWPAGRTHVVPARYAPATPRAMRRANVLAWAAMPGAVRYEVYRNGARIGTTPSQSFALTPRDGLDEYQVLAVNASGDASFLSEPVRVVPPSAEQFAKASDAPLRLTREANTDVALSFDVARAGTYAIDVRYANGSGPVNTEDKVAIRTALVDADTAGVLVMPQRGSNAWEDFGWSNVLRMRLTAGKHTLRLVYTPLDENMNRHVNTALLDGARVTRLAIP